MAVLAFLLCILIGQIVSTAWGLHFGIRKHDSYATSRIYLLIPSVVIAVQFPPGSGLPGMNLKLHPQTAH